MGSDTRGSHDRLRHHQLSLKKRGGQICFQDRWPIHFSGGAACQLGWYYSRSPKTPALQLLQKSSKSASTTPQRPIWNTFGTVAVRKFWENDCTFTKEAFALYSPLIVSSGNSPDFQAGRRYGREGRDSGTSSYVNGVRVDGVIFQSNLPDPAQTPASVMLPWTSTKPDARRTRPNGRMPSHADGETRTERILPAH